MIGGMAAVYRANLHAIARYVPPPLDGPLTVFLTGEAQGDGGWSTLARGPVRVRRAQGDHTTMVLSPCVISLALAISEEMDIPG
jgi:hypothetical protein